MLKRALLLLTLLSLPAMAQSVTLRPEPAVSETPAVPLPRPRPAQLTQPQTSAALPTGGTGASGRAQMELKIYQTACPAVLSGKVAAQSLPPIREGQCGVQSPLSVEAVSANGRSIPLNAPVTTDCGMASALPEWIADIDTYAKAKERVEIEAINIGTGYMCRNVNSAEAGNLSFHAFADAVDLIGFTLSDGRRISIAPGFNGTPEQGRDILRFARDAACTHFTTVLSPDADAAHQDNLHVDLACHGRSCTTRMCQ